MDEPNCRNRDSDVENIGVETCGGGIGEQWMRSSAGILKSLKARFLPDYSEYSVHDIIYE